MTITFRHPSSNDHHAWPWVAAGAAAVLVAAGTYTGVRAITSSDGGSSPASADVAPDPMGLGAALSVRPPARFIDDPMGLGAILGVQYAAEVVPVGVVDPMGLGAALSVQFPAG